MLIINATRFSYFSEYVSVIVIRIKRREEKTNYPERTSMIAGHCTVPVSEMQRAGIQIGKEEVAGRRDRSNISMLSGRRYSMEIN